jgi:hypothetical protein
MGESAMIDLKFLLRGGEKWISERTFYTRGEGRGNPLKEKEAGTRKAFYQTGNLPERP